MQQISFDDIERENALAEMPGRTAYIDECGNFGFDFESGGSSEKYILCAVVVKNSDLPRLHAEVEAVKNANGFKSSEMKSKDIGNNYKRRNKIVSELMRIDFRVVLFVADKTEFYDGSPIATYRKTFIKFLHQRLYNSLYGAYPKLKIIEDEIGTSEFQESFKEYVRNNRPQNLFTEYDFDYTDSKDTLLVQLADIIGGSISKALTDAESPNYLEMLKGKILSYEEFPNKNEPYWGKTKEADRKYDKDIFALSLHRARSFIAEFEEDESFEKKLQVAAIKYLLFHVQNINATAYISSHQMLSFLEEYADTRIRLNYLYRKVIAPLRDAKVLIASCPQGYKIPVSAEDITTYINQTHTVVSPMLHRIGICRELIQQQTDGRLDVLDDPAFLKYKKYFD